MLYDVVSSKDVMKKLCKIRPSMVKYRHRRPKNIIKEKIDFLSGVLVYVLSFIVVKNV